VSDDEDLKARLLKPRLPEADVEIPGVGTVRVRALNRKEAVHVQEATDSEEKDRRLLAMGLVNPMFMMPWPKLHSLGADPCEKCAAVGELQEASPANELEPVSDKITELAGYSTPAKPKPDKEVYKKFEDDPDAEFRVLPSAKADDDGSGNAGANEQR